MSQPIIHGESASEISVLRAAWQYKWLVASIAIATTALALWVTSIRPLEVVAEASIVLEDLETSNLLGAIPAASSERRLRTQLEIITSTEVAARAADLAGDAGVFVSTQDILSTAEVTSLSNSNVIKVSFTGETDGQSIVVAQAIVDAYESFLSEQAAQELSTRVGRLESAEEILRAQLGEVNGRINALRASRELNSQLAAVLDLISEVEQGLLADPDEETRAVLLERQSDLESRLRTLQLATELESEQPELASALRQRADLVDQLSEIASRQIDLEIETRTSRAGIAYTLPAAVTEASRGAGRVFTAVAGLFLGLLGGAGVAYLLTTSFRRFEDRLEPAMVVGVPLLADVPRFDDPVVLPVRDDPRSPAAEAIRFAASSVVLRMQRDGHRSLLVASASVGNGKSTIAADLALAAARSGKNVLAIDADFGNQSLFNWLVGDLPLSPGLTDLSTGGRTLVDVTREVRLAGETGITVMGRGTEPITAGDFFSARSTQAILSRIMDAFDLVVIDAPPLTQVAYSTTIASFCDAAVLVIPHGSNPKAAQELIRRLEFVEIDILGYVYNFAPDRPEMAESGGSMRDILGDAGRTDAKISPRASKRNR